jgi:6-phosphogluconolactonase/glucosamine-6-phosphate isomerase/deaminase
MKSIHAENADGGAHELAAKIMASLERGKKVLWLVPGGSNIAVAVFVMKTIRKGEPTSAFSEGAPIRALANLTVALTDERYGPVGHPDSNWEQLIDAGFDFDNVNAIPVLRGLPLDETVSAYGDEMRSAFERADAVIGHFGIGADGHIAGILPHSPAVAEPGPVNGYEAGAYTRITLTPAILRRVTAAFAFAFGSSKAKAIRDLRDAALPLEDQPAQILNMLGEAYLFSDQA